MWCWSEAELLLCSSQDLCSSCLWGSSVISTASLGFSREHNLPVSHSFSLFSQCSFERIEAFSENSEGIAALA